MAKILIVDDDQDIIDSLSMVLEAHKHQVEVKTDIADLEATVLDMRPELIILDIMFPDDPEAGFIAARTLRGKPVLRDIPLLVLSAVNQRSNMAFGFSDKDISNDFMPVDGFLEKPVEPQVLLQRVDALLDGRGVSKGA